MVLGEHFQEHICEEVDLCTLSVVPSGEPGVSGDFWGSQEGCQGPPAGAPGAGMSWFTRAPCWPQGTSGIQELVGGRVVSSLGTCAPMRHTRNLHAHM